MCALANESEHSTHGIRACCRQHRLRKAFMCMCFFFPLCAWHVRAYIHVIRIAYACLYTYWCMRTCVHAVCVSHSTAHCTFLYKLLIYLWDTAHRLFLSSVFAFWAQVFWLCFLHTWVKYIDIFEWNTAWYIWVKYRLIYWSEKHTAWCTLSKIQLNVLE